MRFFLPRNFRRYGVVVIEAYDPMDQGCLFTPPGGRMDVYPNVAGADRLAELVEVAIRGGLLEGRGAPLMGVPVK